MKRIVFILLVANFILTACTRNAENTPAPLPESILVAEPASTAPAPTNECLACHTDKQMLIDTAKPEEVQVKESSGAG